MTEIWREPWMDEGLCNKLPHDWFFHGKGHNTKGDMAKSYCMKCPVQADCLDYAVVNFGGTTDFGIWGGTNARERRGLRRKRKAAA